MYLIICIWAFLSLLHSHHQISKITCLKLQISTDPHVMTRHLISDQNNVEWVSVQV